MDAWRIIIKGTVQGVGFRPAVARVARELKARGYVRNLGGGEVEIVIDLHPEKFLEKLFNNLPRLARVEDVRMEKIGTHSLPDPFAILKSTSLSSEIEETIRLPPPDTAICEICLAEVFSKKNRRYLYAFTSCTACGPRFTVFLALPFDRENTTFSSFPLCADCTREYEDEINRRYHAQTTCCPVCGPSYSLVSSDGETIAEGLEAIRMAARMVDDGKIIAVKGWGGYHLVCDAEKDGSVRKLRKKLRRPQQPFAVMARDMNAVRGICILNEREAEEISSPARPIVILRKKHPSIMKEVAPMLHTLGVMLPYSALHHILFSHLNADFIVVTSANLPGEPMMINENIIKKIRVDAYLIHNLRIANRCDDSVHRVVDESRVFVRRSRGFVPFSLELGKNTNALCLGAELFNSVCFVKNGRAYLSQYLGDTSNYLTYREHFIPTIQKWRKWLSLDKCDAIVCDLHPSYTTTFFAESIAERLDIPLYRLQHHFAHAMGVMFEHNIERAVAICCDGTGYGLDGSVWGGEVLYIDFEKHEFARVGRLENFPLVGGDSATLNPRRIAASLLFLAGMEEEAAALLEEKERELVMAAIRNKINVVGCSSAGRVFDGMASILNIYDKRTYEGEGAMKLEAMASLAEGKCGEIESLKPKITTAQEATRYRNPYLTEGCEGNPQATQFSIKVLEISKLVKEAFEKMKEGWKRERIAFEMFSYVGQGLATIAVETAKKRDCKIILAGGCMVNPIFVKSIMDVTRTSGVETALPQEVPVGDNGISMGQAYLLKFVETG